jgi:translation initiation factor IF-1
MLLVRPEQANGSALKGVICETVYLGTDTRFVVRLDSGTEIVARVQNHGGAVAGNLAVGDAVKVLWDVHDARALA